MDIGRVQCILVATTSGNVVYERFYDRLGENDKAELRASLAEAAERCSVNPQEGTEYASRYRENAVALKREGDLYLFAVGSGEYDELYLAEIVGAFGTALRDILRKIPTEAHLFDNYARLCLIVDELLFEGLLDKTEPEQIQRGIMMKAD